MPAGTVPADTDAECAVAEGTFGPYRLVSRIGTGGMGEVWRAVDTRKSREVALKLIRAGAASDPDYAPRFRREAELAARLPSPHIVPIHDYGEIDGQLFLDMPLVDGTDLGGPSTARARSRPRGRSGIVDQVAERSTSPTAQAWSTATSSPRTSLVAPTRGRTATSSTSSTSVSPAPSDSTTISRGGVGDRHPGLHGPRAVRGPAATTAATSTPCLPALRRAHRASRLHGRLETPAPRLRPPARAGRPRCPGDRPCPARSTRDRPRHGEGPDRALPQRRRLTTAARAALTAPRSPPRLAAREVAAGDPHGAGVAPDRSTGERRTPPPTSAPERARRTCRPRPAERRRPPPPDPYARCQPGRCTAPPAEGNTRYAGVPRPARPSDGTRPRLPRPHPHRPAEVAGEPNPACPSRPAEAFGYSPPSVRSWSCSPRRAGWPGCG